MIISEQIPGGIRIRVEGRLDTGTAPEFRKVLNSVSDDTEVLTVDLAGTYYVSSAGLRELLVARKRFRDDRMRVISVNETVREIFHTTGFDTLFPVESGDGEGFVQALRAAVVQPDASRRRDARESALYDGQDLAHVHDRQLVDSAGGHCLRAGQRDP